MDNAEVDEEFGQKREGASRAGPGDRRARSLTGRALQFLGGVLLCSIAIWMSLQAGLGLAPWDVLHAGISRLTGLTFGTTVIAVGVVVVLISVLIRVRLGIGTVLNALIIGAALDVLISTTWLNGLPAEPLVFRLLALGASVVLLGLGISLYIGAGFGAGPRDSLMVGIHQRGIPLGWARLVIEVSVLTVGWLLGGTVGIGTIVLALGTGPAVHASFKFLRQTPNRQ